MFVGRWSGTRAHESDLLGLVGIRQTLDAAGVGVDDTLVSSVGQLSEQERSPFGSRRGRFKTWPKSFWGADPWETVTPATL